MAHHGYLLTLGSSLCCALWVGCLYISEHLLPRDQNPGCTHPAAQPVGCLWTELCSCGSRLGPSILLLLQTQRAWDGDRELCRPWEHAWDTEALVPSLLCVSKLLQAPAMFPEIFFLFLPPLLPLFFLLKPTLCVTMQPGGCSGRPPASVSPPKITSLPSSCLLVGARTPRIPFTSLQTQGLGSVCACNLPVNKADLASLLCSRLHVWL